VEQILSIVRHPTGPQHPKLTELVHQNYLDFSAIEPQLTGHDACFYCLGVSSSGMTEDRYTRVIYDMTMAAAQTLLRLNPSIAFLFISGAGTDGTENGRVMWARVKGKTENALLRLPFKAAYMFRPGIIEPLHGIKSRTTSYRIGYAVAKPVFPLLRLLLPHQVTTTERLGRAMLRVAQSGFPKRILETRDINQV
jgi:uncharacterized protein YbjT (DUF2867 family)